MCFFSLITAVSVPDPYTQKNKNTQTGSQFAKSQEDAAAIMRDKQKKGAFR